uniref:Uncharacterized protein n=1 Tax=Arundo donax TaxID=35708 RepID=A0A0A9AZV6_ARUDO
MWRGRSSVHFYRRLHSAAAPPV